MSLEVVRGALALPSPLPSSVVTLGTFDGVHRGHQALIARAVERAHEIGVSSVVYTFDPHPAKVLAPERAPATLIPTEERIRRIAALGIDLIVVEPFTPYFSQVAAEEWVARYLVGQLHPKHVVVGFNFSYGRGREGRPDVLTAEGRRHGFAVDVVQPFEVNGHLVSSSLLRERLIQGDVEVAADLLGRPFSLTGVVVEGDRRGRTIGVPTANLAPENELLPASGVYATRVLLESGRRFGSVTNIGTRPTFAGKKTTVEAHLFDFSGDLYGRRIEIELIARLRPEMRFEGIDALVAQIRRDIAAAKALLS